MDDNKMYPDPTRPKETRRRLTSAAQDDRNEFEAAFGSNGGCSCHINPPCSSCVHPGNPLNQDEDDDCWEDDNGE